MSIDSETGLYINDFIEWVKTCSINEFEQSYKDELHHSITYSENAIIRIMCSLGYLDEIKIIVNDNPEIDMRIKNDECFRNACQNGHLDLVKWLLNNYPDINITTYDNQSFRFACIKGHFDVAQWLYSMNPSIVFQNRKHKDLLFPSVCFFGFTPIAKWLLEIMPDIDVHFHEDIAFRHSCNNNKLETAKWLFESFPKINIESNNHEAFNNASLQLCNEVAFWLQSLKPDIYNLDIENGKIVKHSIRPNLEIKVEGNDEVIYKFKDISFQKQLDLEILESLCPICQDCEWNVKTICNHTFCYNCINKWYKNKNDVCPVCKTGSLTHVFQR